MAGTMIACNGWLDVLLYASTRADIVFAEVPPGEGTGLDTFNFMGKQVTGSRQGTTTSTSAGTAHGGNESRIALRVRSPDGGNGGHVYSMGQIGVTGEVTVSSTSLEEGLVQHERMGNQASAVSIMSPITSDGKSMKSLKSEA